MDLDTILEKAWKFKTTSVFDTLWVQRQKDLTTTAYDFFSNADNPFDYNSKNKHSAALFDLCTIKYLEYNPHNEEQDKPEERCETAIRINLQLDACYRFLDHVSDFKRDEINTLSEAVPFEISYTILGLFVATEVAYALYRLISDADKIKIERYEKKTEELFSSEQLYRE